MGILHRDLNKHNFLISDEGDVLIDFKTAMRSDSIEAMEQELNGLEEQLSDESGNGGVILEEEKRKKIIKDFIRKPTMVEIWQEIFGSRQMCADAQLPTPTRINIYHKLHITIT